MYIKIFKTLPDESKSIRTAVFVNEQGFINEFDDIDCNATHIVLYNESDIAVATCRVFKGEEHNTYILGRIAVLKEFRNNGYGKNIITEAEKHVKNIGRTQIILHSQLRIKDFYKKLGYTEFGETDYDEDCPHIWMRKKLVQK